MNCHYCKTEIQDPSELRQAVWGWEHRVPTRATGTQGGSDIQFRQHFDRYAHARCIALAKAGVSVFQETLV